jgi:hypothetical protein
MKPRNWKPVAWLPVYDESRDTRPRTGFDSTSARMIRLYHACWSEFLDRWAERTRDAIEIPWADSYYVDQCIYHIYLIVIASIYPIHVVLSTLLLG